MERLLISENTGKIQSIESDTNKTLIIAVKINNAFKRLHENFASGLQKEEIEKAFRDDNFIQDKLIEISGDELKGGIKIDRNILKRMLQMPVGIKDFEVIKEEFANSNNYSTRAFYFNHLTNLNGEIIIDDTEYQQTLESYRFYVNDKDQLERYSMLKGLADNINYFISSKFDGIDIEYFNLLERNLINGPVSISGLGVQFIMGNR